MRWSSSIPWSEPVSDQDQEKQLIPSKGTKICPRCPCDFTWDCVTWGEVVPCVTSTQDSLMVQTHEAASESTGSSHTQKVTTLPWFVSVSNSVLGGGEKGDVSTMTSLLPPCGGNCDVTPMCHKHRHDNEIHSRCKWVPRRNKLPAAGSQTHCL